MEATFRMRNPFCGSALTLVAVWALLVLGPACGYAQVAERLSAGGQI